jgi:hypothetical protein
MNKNFKFDFNSQSDLAGIKYQLKKECDPEFETN